MPTRKLTGVELHDTARQLAKTIAAVDTDQRGELLKLVALDLQKRHQNHTASCMMHAAVRYN